MMQNQVRHRPEVGFCGRAKCQVPKPSAVPALLLPSSTFFFHHNSTMYAASSSAACFGETSSALMSAVISRGRCLGLATPSLWTPRSRRQNDPAETRLHNVCSCPVGLCCIGSLLQSSACGSGISRSSAVVPDCATRRLQRFLSIRGHNHAGYSRRGHLSVRRHAIITSTRLAPARGRGVSVGVQLTSQPASSALQT